MFLHKLELMINALVVLIDEHVECLIIRKINSKQVEQLVSVQTSPD